MSMRSGHLIEMVDGVSLADGGVSAEGSGVKPMPVSENGLSLELLEGLAALGAEKTATGGLRLMGEGGILRQPAELVPLPPRLRRKPCAPNPLVLRQHLGHLRAARRTLATPDDPAARADLDNAAYTLCVLMEQRTTHAAIQAAEQHLADHRPAPGRPEVRTCLSFPGVARGPECRTCPPAAFWSLVRPASEIAGPPSGAFTGNFAPLCGPPFPGPARSRERQRSPLARVAAVGGAR
ncbi:DUF5133 domain-containing protein [Streptomyces sp. NPDC051366]|uniref:DUF5133 domain-containing protein n=1 Tax=Streptomyces sp. NPDC051366 TaxID=3365652 RepID=UPI00378D5756